MLALKRSLGILRLCPKINLTFRKCTTSTNHVNKLPVHKSEAISLSTTFPEKEINILAPDSAQDFDFSDYGPELVPTFNLAAYANRSPTLQKLIDLGVNFPELEKKYGVPEFILSLDFERDMKKHIQFLHDIGVPVDHLGYFITKCPMVFKEDLETLNTRIQFLHSRNYTKDMIATIVCRNPFWILFSVDRIEKRLDFVKEHFQLQNQAACRRLSCIGPRLITYNLWHVRVTSFSMKDEMGFNETEMKNMVLHTPKLWMIQNKSLIERFNVIHNEMKIPHSVISRQSNALLQRARRLRQRHLFLSSRGLAQYDPKLPNYVSLKSLVSGTDAVFAVDIARSSLPMYSNFLKTL